MDPNGTCGGQTPCYTTIEAAVTAAFDNDVINVGPGTYVLAAQLVIDKDLSIFGSGPGLSIIQAGFNTTAGGNVQSEALIYVAPGTIVDMSGFEVDGTGFQVHHAIQSRADTLYIEDCDIHHITYGAYLGRGVVVYTGLTIVYACTFSDIERIGVHARGAVEPLAPEVLVSTCTYTGKGPGLHLDYAFETGGGALLEVAWSVASDCLGVAYDGSTSAGALATTYFGTGTYLEMYGSVFQNCTAAAAVGYDEYDETVAVIWDNDLSAGGVGNSNPANLVDAGNNWFGSADPTVVAGLVEDGIDYSPWFASGDADPNTPEFEPDYSVLWVDDDSPQYNEPLGAIEEALSWVTGSTVNLAPGIYEEQVYITSPLDYLSLVGSGSGGNPAVDSIIRAPTGTMPNSFTTGTLSNYPVVFVDTVFGVTLDNLRVDGYGRGNDNYRFLGIGFWDADGTVEDCFVTGIQDTPFSGAQHGVGIYASNDDGGPYALSILRTSVEEYQKNAMALNGAGLTVTVEDCTVTGKGATNVTAQNGIQISAGAGGTIDGCTVTGHMYTGGNWASTGILLYGATPVSVLDTDATENLPSVYCLDTDATFNDLRVNHAAATAGDGLYVYNSTTYGDGPEHAPRLMATPLDGFSTGGPDGAPVTVAISNSSFLGNGAQFSWGVGVFSDDTADTTVTMTDCTVSNWDEGIVAYYDAGSGYTGPLDMSVTACTIAGNTSHGLLNTYPATLVAAEGNRWGGGDGPLDDAGTYEVSFVDCGATVADMKNEVLPGALGNAVSDNVDYCPWLADAVLTLRPLGGETCYKPGDILTVEVYLSDVSTPANIVGGDFFLTYDAAKLALVDDPNDSAVRPGDAPFVVEVYECSTDHTGFNCTPAAGLIDYSVGVTPGGPGTSDPTVMARMDFLVLTGTNACSLPELVQFRPHDPPTKLSQYQGAPAAPAMVNLEALAIDAEAPQIVITLDDGIQDPNCVETVIPVTIVVTDNCGVLLADVTYSLTASGGTLNTGGVTAVQTNAQTVTISGNLVLTAPPCEVNISAQVDAYDCPLNHGTGADVAAWDDLTPPTFTAPANRTQHADPGLCTAVLVPPIDPPVGADCHTPVTVEYKRSDRANWNEGLTEPYPAGVTTITWKATDACTNVAAEQFQTVTIEDVNDIVFNVEIDTLLDGPVTRCVTFEVWDCTNPVIVLPTLVDFTPAGTHASGTVTLTVPCGRTYTCITARDTLHALRRTVTPTTGGSPPTWIADFTGAAGKRLLSGNLNDDAWIDILDFGVFSWQWGVNYGSGNTTCATPYPHADLTGDGVVGSGDFTAIQINYIQGREANCCGAGGDNAGTPVTRIALAELAKLGLAELAAGDWNHDGWLDADDIDAFLGQGQVRLGDLNCDGAVDFGDINPFVLALGNPGAWQSQYPGCPRANGDINRDGRVDFADINAFTGLLSR
ncbi:MAG: right-handed parallel beta-helix repeat-containing protein [Planctomycetota bacterium]